MTKRWNRLISLTLAMFMVFTSVSINNLVMADEEYTPAPVTSLEQAIAAAMGASVVPGEGQTAKDAFKAWGAARHIDDLSNVSGSIIFDVSNANNDALSKPEVNGVPTLTWKTNDPYVLQLRTSWSALAGSGGVIGDKYFAIQPKSANEALRLRVLGELYDAASELSPEYINAAGEVTGDISSAVAIRVTSSSTNAGVSSADLALQFEGLATTLGDSITFDAYMYVEVTTTRTDYITQPVEPEEAGEEGEEAPPPETTTVPVETKTKTFHVEKASVAVVATGATSWMTEKFLLGENGSKVAEGNAPLVRYIAESRMYELSYLINTKRSIVDNTVGILKTYDLFLEDSFRMTTSGGKAVPFPAAVSLYFTQDGVDTALTKLDTLEDVNNTVKAQGDYAVYTYDNVTGKIYIAVSDDALGLASAESYSLEGGKGFIKAVASFEAEGFRNPIPVDNQVELRQIVNAVEGYVYYTPDYVPFLTADEYTGELTAPNYGGLYSNPDKTGKTSMMTEVTVPYTIGQTEGRLTVKPRVTKEVVTSNLFESVTSTPDDGRPTVANSYITPEFSSTSLSMADQSIAYSLKLSNKDGADGDVHISLVDDGLSFLNTQGSSMSLPYAIDSLVFPAALFGSLNSDGSARVIDIYYKTTNGDWETLSYATPIDGIVSFAGVTTDTDKVIAFRVDINSLGVNEEVAIVANATLFKTGEVFVNSEEAAAGTAAAALKEEILGKITNTSDVARIVTVSGGAASRDTTMGNISTAALPVQAGKLTSELTKTTDISNVKTVSGTNTISPIQLIIPGKTVDFTIVYTNNSDSTAAFDSVVIRDEKVQVVSQNGVLDSFAYTIANLSVNAASGFVTWITAAGQSAPVAFNAETPLFVPASVALAADDGGMYAPIGFELTLPALPAGSSYTVLYGIDASALTIGAGDTSIALVNKADATAVFGGYVAETTATDSKSISTATGASAAKTVDKTDMFTYTGVNTRQGSLVVDGVNMVGTAQTLTYTVRVQNTGEVPVDVYLNDTGIQARGANNTALASPDGVVDISNFGDFAVYPVVNNVRGETAIPAEDAWVGGSAPAAGASFNGTIKALAPGAVYDIVFTADVTLLSGDATTAMRALATLVNTVESRYGTVGTSFLTGGTPIGTQTATTYVNHTEMTFNNMNKSFVNTTNVLPRDGYQVAEYDISGQFQTLGALQFVSFEDNSFQLIRDEDGEYVDAVNGDYATKAAHIWFTDVTIPNIFNTQNALAAEGISAYVEVKYYKDLADGNTKDDWTKLPDAQDIAAAFRANPALKSIKVPLPTELANRVAEVRLVLYNVPGSANTRALSVNNAGMNGIRVAVAISELATYMASVQADGIRNDASVDYSFYSGGHGGTRPDFSGGAQAIAEPDYKFEYEKKLDLLETTSYAGVKSPQTVLKIGGTTYSSIAGASNYKLGYDIDVLGKGSPVDSLIIKETGMNAFGLQNASLARENSSAMEGTAVGTSEIATIKHAEYDAAAHEKAYKKANVPAPNGKDIAYEFESVVVELPKKVSYFKSGATMQTTSYFTAVTVTIDGYKADGSKVTFNDAVYMGNETDSIPTWTFNLAGKGIVKYDVIIKQNVQVASTSTDAKTNKWIPGDIQVKVSATAAVAQSWIDGLAALAEGGWHLGAIKNTSAVEYIGTVPYTNGASTGVLPDAALAPNGKTYTTPTAPTEAGLIFTRGLNVSSYKSLQYTTQDIDAQAAFGDKWQRVTLNNNNVNADTPVNILDMNSGLFGVLYQISGTNTSTVNATMTLSEKDISFKDYADKVLGTFSHTINAVYIPVVTLTDGSADMGGFSAADSKVYLSSAKNTAVNFADHFNTANPETVTMSVSKDSGGTGDVEVTFLVYRLKSGAAVSAVDAVFNNVSTVEYTTETFSPVLYNNRRMLVEMQFHFSDASIPENKELAEGASYNFISAFNNRATAMTTFNNVSVSKESWSNSKTATGSVTYISANIYKKAPTKIHIRTVHDVGVEVEYKIGGFGHSAQSGSPLFDYHLTDDLVQIIEGENTIAYSTKSENAELRMPSDVYRVTKIVFPAYTGYAPNGLKAENKIYVFPKVMKDGKVQYLKSDGSIVEAISVSGFSEGFEWIATGLTLDAATTPGIPAEWVGFEVVSRELDSSFKYFNSNGSGSNDPAIVITAMVGNLLNYTKDAGSEDAVDALATTLFGSWRKLVNHVSQSGWMDVQANSSNEASKRIRVSNSKEVTTEFEGHISDKMPIDKKTQANFASIHDTTWYLGKAVAKYTIFDIKNLAKHELHDVVVTDKGLTLTAANTEIDLSEIPFGYKLTSVTVKSDVIKDNYTNVEIRFKDNEGRTTFTKENASWTAEGWTIGAGDINGATTFDMGIATLPVGIAFTVDVEYTLDVMDYDIAKQIDQITNTATVAYSDGNTKFTGVDVPANTAVNHNPQPISVKKTVVAPKPLTLGAAVQWTVNLWNPQKTENNRESVLINPTFIDFLPADSFAFDASSLRFMFGTYVANKPEPFTQAANTGYMEVGVPLTLSDGRIITIADVDVEVVKTVHDGNAYSAHRIIVKVEGDLYFTEAIRMLMPTEFGGTLAGKPYTNIAYATSYDQSIKEGNEGDAFWGKKFTESEYEAYGFGGGDSSQVYARTTESVIISASNSVEIKKAVIGELDLFTGGYDYIGAKGVGMPAGITAWDGFRMGNTVANTFPGSTENYYKISLICGTNQGNSVIMFGDLFPEANDYRGSGWTPEVTYISAAYKVKYNTVTKKEETSIMSGVSILVSDDQITKNQLPGMNASGWENLGANGVAIAEGLSSGSVYLNLTGLQKGDLVEFYVKFTAPDDAATAAPGNPGIMTMNSPQNPLAVSTSYLRYGTFAQESNYAVIQANQASLGDRVWIDSADNGLQKTASSEDEGVEGIEVLLFRRQSESMDSGYYEADAEGYATRDIKVDDLVVYASTFTDAYGNYKFDVVLDGYYQIGFVKQPAFEFSGVRKAEGSAFGNSQISRFYDEDYTKDAYVIDVDGKEVHLTDIVHMEPAKESGRLNLTLDAGILYRSAINIEKLLSHQVEGKFEVDVYGSFMDLQDRTPVTRRYTLTPGGMVKIDNLKFGNAYRIKEAGEAEGIVTVDGNSFNVTYKEDGVMVETVPMIVRAEPVNGGLKVVTITNDLIIPDDTTPPPVVTATPTPTPTPTPTITPSEDPEDEDDSTPTPTPTQTQTVVTPPPVIVETPDDLIDFEDGENPLSGYTFVEQDDGTFLVFDEFGTPLGFVLTPDLEGLEDMLPLGGFKLNPKTNDEGILMTGIYLGGALVALVAVVSILVKWNGKKEQKQDKR